MLKRALSLALLVGSGRAQASTTTKGTTTTTTTKTVITTSGGKTTTTGSTTKTGSFWGKGKGLPSAKAPAAKASSVRLGGRDKHDWGLEQYQVMSVCHDAVSDKTHEYLPKESQCRAFCDADTKCLGYDTVHYDATDEEAEAWDCNIYHHDDFKVCHTDENKHNYYRKKNCSSIKAEAIKKLVSYHDDTEKTLYKLEKLTTKHEQTVTTLKQTTKELRIATRTNMEISKELEQTQAKVTQCYKRSDKWEDMYKTMLKKYEQCEARHFEKVEAVKQCARDLRQCGDARDRLGDEKHTLEVKYKEVRVYETKYYNEKARHDHTKRDLTNIKQTLRACRSEKEAMYERMIHDNIRLVAKSAKQSTNRKYPAHCVFDATRDSSCKRGLDRSFTNKGDDQYWQVGFEYISIVKEVDVLQYNSGVGARNHVYIDNLYCNTYPTLTPGKWMKMKCLNQLPGKTVRVIT